MYYNEIHQINSSLEKTKKAVISFGCSWAEGQGAIPMEILENYEYHCPQLGVPYEIKFKTPSEKEELLKKYSEIIESPDGALNFRRLERKNNFAHILCNKYFEGQYTPINFGLSGSGNKASINQIHLYPQIRWDLIEELIILYFPTSPDRLSFINDQFDDHFKFTTIWPHADNHCKPPLKDLWSSYFHALHSDKFAYLEALLDMGQLRNWAGNFNSKLIVFPAFTDYSREKFLDAIMTPIIRDFKTNKQVSHTHQFGENEKKYLTHLVDNQWPWETVWTPDGALQWDELIMRNEPNCNEPLPKYVGIGTENYWITPCMHPSIKAHDDIAERLHNHIVTELK